MGHCTEGQTSHGPVDVELRRESVKFHEDESNDELNLFGHDGHIEISYNYLRRIAELLDQPEWRKRLLGEGK